jgi:hypothetical protein
MAYQNEITDRNMNVRSSRLKNRMKKDKPPGDAERPSLELVVLRSAAQLS